MVILLVLLLFPGVATGLTALMSRDAGVFGIPNLFYLRQSWLGFEIPLWNPLNNSGIPFLAQWNTCALYPGSILYLLPFPWCAGVFTLGHLVLGILGMHQLAHRWTQNSQAAVLAAMSFGFGGFMLSSLVWPHIVAALAWTPWAALLAQEAAVERDMRSAAKLGVVAGLQLLTGAPEISLVSAGFSLVVGMAAAREGQWLGAFRTLVLAGTFALMLSAAQLLPFLQLLAESDRSVAATNLEAALPIYGWANLLLPVFRNARTADGTFFQPEQFWLPSVYAGLPCVVFAGCGLMQWRDRRVRILAAIALAGLWLAFGDQAGLLRGLRAVFPPVNWVNFPVKWVVLCSVSLPLLAAIGWASLHRERGSTDVEARTSDLGLLTECRTGRRLAVIAGGVCLLVVTLAVWSAATPRPFEQPAVTLANAGVRLALLLGILAVLMDCRAAKPRIFKHRRAQWAALAALIALDGILHNPGLTRTGPARVLTEAVGASAGAEFAAQNSRIHISKQARAKAERINLPNPGETLAGFRRGRFYNCNLLERIPKTDGFYPLNLASQQLADSLLESPQGELNQKFADFLGVSQMTSRSNALTFEKRDSAQPLITAGQTPLYLPLREQQSRLASVAFDPVSEVFLPLEAAARISARREAEARVRVLSWSAHRIEFEVHTPRPCLAVIAQSWYPAWQASIERARIPIWKANLGFQAIECPAGTHRVSLEYRDRWYWAGAWISAITVIGLGIKLARVEA